MENGRKEHSLKTSRTRVGSCSDKRMKRPRGFSYSSTITLPFHLSQRKTWRDNRRMSTNQIHKWGEITQHRRNKKAIRKRTRWKIWNTELQIISIKEITTLERTCKRSWIRKAEKSKEPGTKPWVDQSHSDVHWFLHIKVQLFVTKGFPPCVISPRTVHTGKPGSPTPGGPTGPGLPVKPMSPFRKKYVMFGFEQNYGHWNEAAFFDLIQWY